MYDDTRRAGPPGGEARALDMLTAHHMLAYAHNLETLAVTLTGLTVWTTPDEAGYTVAQVRSLLAGAVFFFPQVVID